jgi:hypothetical protein
MPATASLHAADSVNFEAPSSTLVKPVGRDADPRRGPIDVLVAQSPFDRGGVGVALLASGH